MAWSWSNPTSTGKSESNLSTPQPPEPQSSPAVTESTPSKSLSRDELAEQELQSFLAEIAADTQPSSTKYNRVPRPLPSNTSKAATSAFQSPSAQIPQTGEDSISEQLLPTDMSCRTAFDAAFYCNSFGGRFNDLYRYGTLRSCSSSWNDFWFCMRTRGFSDAEKQNAIKNHYRRKEVEKYGRVEGLGQDGDYREDKDGKGEEGKKWSSEDVWRSREKKVEWGTAFRVPVDPPFEGSDEEWNRKERERRMGVIEASTNGG